MRWRTTDRICTWLCETKTTPSITSQPVVLSSQGSLQPTFLVMLCFAQSENLYLEAWSWWRLLLFWGLFWWLCCRNLIFDYFKKLYWKVPKTINGKRKKIVGKSCLLWIWIARSFRTVQFFSTHHLGIGCKKMHSFTQFPEIFIGPSSAYLYL